MKEPDARRALVIRLDRRGAALTRVHHVTGHPRQSSAAVVPREELTAELAWSSLGADLQFDGAVGLDAIARLLDRGSLDDLAVHLPDTGPTAVGEILFQTLFGGPGAPESALRTPLDPVRVRILTTSPVLSGLPWRLTSRGGERLADHGWTFEVTPETPAPHDTFSQRPWGRTLVVVEGTADPDRPRSLLRRDTAELPAVRMPAAPRVLVVADDVPGALAIEAAAHVEALRGELALLSRRYEDAASFRVVGTPAGLERAIRQMAPQVIHCHAPLTLRDGVAHLALSGGAALVSIATLIGWMAPSPPLIVYLNGRISDAASWSTASAELAPGVPLVVGHRTWAWPDDAGPTAASWLAACVAGTEDPVLAFHRPPAPPAEAGLHRRTATVHTSYGRWTAEPEAEPPSEMDHARRRALQAPRAAVLDQVASLMWSDEHRVTVLVAYGASGTLVDQGSRVLLDELEIRGSDLARVRSMDIELPPRRDEAFAEITAHLLDDLDVASHGSLERALRSVAPGPEATAIPPLLWLDWGVFGASPRRTLHTGQLAAWLDVCGEVLAPSCPEDLRIISFLATELDPAKHEGFAGWMAEQQKRAAGARMKIVLLPAFTPMNLAEIRSCVKAAIAGEEPRRASRGGATARASTWDDASLEELAKLVLAHTGGGHEATAAVLREAEAMSWTALRGMLRSDGAGETSDEEDEEIA